MCGNRNDELECNYDIVEKIHFGRQEEVQNKLIKIITGITFYD